MLAAYDVILLNVMIVTTPTYVLFAITPLPLAAEAAKHALRVRSEPFRLTPADALTIVVNSSTSLLISPEYLAYRFDTQSLGFAVGVAFAAISSLLTAFIYRRIMEAQKPKV